MRILTAVLLAMSTVAAQGPPPPAFPRSPQGQAPRDVVRRPEPTGTGVIRGLAVAADTGSPIRRASVSLQPTPPPPGTPPPPPPGTSASTTTQTTTVMVNGVPRTVTSSLSATVSFARPRTATTDAQGAFEFTGLPAGSYRLFANAGQYSAAYLAIAYGAKRPNSPMSTDPGTPIVLADGQRFDKATIALPRGAVITGHVTDDNGDPMARVQVYTMLFTPGSSRGMRTGAGGQTDDLGQFRLYGLAPADYVVVAEARGPTFVPPNAPVETEEDRIGFLTTYFPNTADEASAQRVRTRLGAETPGVEIRMVTGRLFRISGTITDSQGRTSSRTNGSLFRGMSGSASSFGFSTDEQGRFQMRNIPPGNYRLIVRGRQMGPMDGTQNDPGEMANVPLAVNADLEGLVVTTAPGATIIGQVVFEQGPPQLPVGQSFFQMRVFSTLADPQSSMGMPLPQPALVTPDLTFTMKGVMGEFLLRSSGPGMYLKSVMLGAEDITDTPREFKNGDRVTIVMTTRAATVEGTVSDAKGTPVTDASIMVFSDDKASWRSSSIRTRRSGTDQTGHFRLTGLPSGRYFIIAVPRERLSIPSMNQDAAFFEQLSKEATTFVLGEDETRQVDLKVVAGSEG